MGNGLIATLFWLALVDASRSLSRKQDAKEVSICLLMMARDEEALLRRHLPSWLPLLGDNGCVVSVLRHYLRANLISSPGGVIVIAGGSNR
jgi:hypothetical protein